MSTTLLPMPGIPSEARLTVLVVPLTASSNVMRIAVCSMGRRRMRGPPGPPKPPPPKMCSNTVPCGTGWKGAELIIDIACMVHKHRPWPFVPS